MAPVVGSILLHFAVPRGQVTKVENWQQISKLWVSIHSSES
jgi:hypothetical protein